MASPNGDSLANTNGYQTSNTTLASTPQTSLHSDSHSCSGTSSSSGFVAASASASSTEASSVSSSSHLPADARQKYEGFQFVFATDDQHDPKTVHGNGHEDCIRYLKPIRMDDFLSPHVRSYFFTGFDWKDVDGQQCAMSRVKLCDAWQIAFNRLIYYASFLEEKSFPLDANDVEIFKQEFDVWNDLFCELDQTLGRLAQCERDHVLLKFKPSMDLNKLENPTNLTDSKTPLNLLTSTFLCAAREILWKHARENEMPPDHIQEIERNTEGWVPCTGYSVIQVTRWNNDRHNARNDIVTEGESEDAGEFDQGSFQ